MGSAVQRPGGTRIIDGVHFMLRIVYFNQVKSFLGYGCLQPALLRSISSHVRRWQEKRWNGGAKGKMRVNVETLDGRGGEVYSNEKARVLFSAWCTVVTRVVGVSSTTDDSLVGESTNARFREDFKTLPAWRCMYEAFRYPQICINLPYIYGQSVATGSYKSVLDEAEERQYIIPQTAPK